MDTSIKGTGRTVLSLDMIKTISEENDSDMKIIVFCPINCYSVWLEHAKLYNLNINFMATYPNLAKKTDDNKYTYYTEEDGDDAKYYPSTFFEEFTSDGNVVVIFDQLEEVRNLKNDHYRAVRALTDYLQQTFLESKNNYYILLDGPISLKAEDIYTSLGLLGMIKSHDIYSGIEADHDLIKEVIEHIQEIEPDHDLEKYFELAGGKEYSGDIFLKELFGHFAVPWYTGEVLENKKKAFTFEKVIFRDDKFNLDKFNEIATGIEDIKTYKYKMDNVKMKKVSKVLTELELSLYPTMIRMVKNIMNNDPSAKIVIYYNYLKTKKAMANFMNNNNISFLELNASTLSKDRGNIIKYFQEEGSQYKIILVNLMSGCKSISLDDRIGNAKRYCLMYPTHHLGLVGYAANRIYRPEFTESNAYARIIYPYNSKYPIHHKLAVEGVYTKIRNYMMMNSEVNVFLPEGIKEDVTDDLDYLNLISDNRSKYDIEITAKNKVEKYDDYENRLTSWIDDDIDPKPFKPVNVRRIYEKRKRPNRKVVRF
jgi:hypothetical protein